MMIKESSDYQWKDTPKTCLENNPPPPPNKKKFSTQKNTEPAYRAKVQYDKDVKSSKVLDTAEITWVKSIFRTLLFYA